MAADLARGGQMRRKARKASARAKGRRESTQGEVAIARASPKVRQKRIPSDERRFGSSYGLPAFTSGRAAAAKASGDARGQRCQRLGRQASSGKTTPAGNAGRPAEAVLVT